MDMKISSTIGFERAHNAKLAIEDEDAFVEEALAGLGPQPPNFQAIVELNRGPLLTDGVELLPLAPRQVEHQRAAGALVVDVRTDQQFDDAHIPGAIAIPMLYAGFGSRLAWLADREQDVVLVGRDDEDGRRAGRLAVAVGIRRLAGFLHGGMTSWRQEKRPVARIERLPVDELPARDDAPDPRRARAEASGTPGISRARSTRRGTTSTALPEGLDPARPIAVVCGIGPARRGRRQPRRARTEAERVIHVVDGGVPRLLRPAARPRSRGADPVEQARRQPRRPGHVVHEDHRVGPDEMSDLAEDQVGGWPGVPGDRVERPGDHLQAVGGGHLVAERIVDVAERRAPVPRRRAPEPLDDLQRAAEVVLQLGPAHLQVRAVVRPRVRVDLVPGRVHAGDQLRALGCLGAEDEERRAHAAILEHVEDRRRRALVRAVVEGQRDRAATTDGPQLARLSDAAHCTHSVLSGIASAASRDRAPAPVAGPVRALVELGQRALDCARARSPASVRRRCR